MSDDQVLEISDAAAILGRDIPHLLQSPDVLHPDIQSAVSSAFPGALLHSLKSGGVEALDLQGSPMDTPEARVSSILHRGAEVFQENNLPQPDLEAYEAAESLIISEDLNVDQALEAIDARQPFSFDADSIHALPESLQLDLESAGIPPLVLAQDVSHPAADTIRPPHTDAEYSQMMLDNVEDTNFCDMDIDDRFQAFLRWNDVERAADEDFIVEQVFRGSWDELPDEIQNWEPPLWNPYGRVVDDMGAHTENQRFPGGYHLAAEEGHLGVQLHFDAWDPLLGAGANAMHGLEVRRLQEGEIEEIHHPALDNTDPANEGRFPDWERYEDHCSGL